jgi:hypothetical protein
VSIARLSLVGLISAFLRFLLPLPLVHLFDNTVIQIRQESDFHASGWRKCFKTVSPIRSRLSLVASSRLLLSPGIGNGLKLSSRKLFPLHKPTEQDFPLIMAREILELLASYPRGTRSPCFRTVKGVSGLKWELSMEPRRTWPPVPTSTTVNEDPVDRLNNQ